MLKYLLTFFFNTCLGKDFQMVSILDSNLNEFPDWLNGGHRIESAQWLLFELKSFALSCAWSKSCGTRIHSYVLGWRYGYDLLFNDFFIGSQHELGKVWKWEVYNSSVKGHRAHVHVTRAQVRQRNLPSPSRSPQVLAPMCYPLLLSHKHC